METMKIKRTNIKRILQATVCLLLALTLVLGSMGCAVKANDGELMKGDGVSATDFQRRQATDFASAYVDFAVELFQANNQDGNSMIAPLSVMLSLAMAANGANGDTLSEMEEVLCRGLSLEQLNAFLLGYTTTMPTAEKYKFTLANSIWFDSDKDDILVDEWFLQTNADFYGADIHELEFNDAAVDEINKWVNEKTDGRIDSIIEEIRVDQVMFLLNAMILDAEWRETYLEREIVPGTFTTKDGVSREVEMLTSVEHQYIDLDNAQGFIKPYVDSKYGFAAFLPNEGVSLDAFIGGLTGEKLLSAINGYKDEFVSVHLPKFGFECSIEMKDMLKRLGIRNAFDGITADFSRLGTSKQGNILIDSVFQKTYISVDEMGTQVGAVTNTTMRFETLVEAHHEVILDRPFVFAIIDYSTGIPLFIGTVADITK